MGMYTELHYNAELEKDTPQVVIDTLQRMLGDDSKEVEQPFDGVRWEYMLRCDSYYFAADTHSTLRFDDIAQANFLCVRCNLKNYDDEIEKFIQWIDPFVDALPGSFLGFYRYEESETPTLIYKQ